MKWLEMITLRTSGHSRERLVDQFIASLSENIIKTINIFMGILLGTSCFFSCKQGTAREKPPSLPVMVETGRVTMVSEQIYILASGFLEAEKSAPISFQVPGKITKIHFDLGDYVTRNQVIAEIERDHYQSRLEIAEAKLMQTRDAHTRMTPLFKKGVISEQALVEITAGLAQAKAGKNIAEKELRDTRLRSPFSGVIGMKNMENGQMISQGTRVCTIVKNDRIYACSAIPESEIKELRTGQTAAVTVPALGERIFTGPIERIAAVADPETRTYRVKILLKNPEFFLRPGMIARVSIRTDQKQQIISIPGDAIVRDADHLPHVFLVDQTGSRALQTRVCPGRVHKNRIRIKKGLSPGDLIVTAGQHKLVDGCEILILEN